MIKTSRLEDVEPEEVYISLMGSGPKYNSIRKFLEEQGIESDTEVNTYENLSLTVSRDDAMDLTYTENALKALKTLFPDLEEEIEI